MIRPSLLHHLLTAWLAVAVMCPALVLAASAPPTDETAATEAWFIDARADPISNQIRKEAKIINEAGYALTVFRHFNGTVWAEMALPEWRSKTLHHRRLPNFIVDDGDPHDLNRLKEAGSSHYRIEKTRFRIQIHESPGQPKRGLLREIMVGYDLAVSYFDGMGRTHWTSFSLIGSDDAIALALGVPPIGEDAERKAKASPGRTTPTQTPEPENTAAAFDRYVDEHIERCQGYRDDGKKDAYRSCQRIFALCVEKPGQTASQLQQCLEGGDPSS